MDFTTAYREEACRNLLPDINAMAEKLRLPIELPVTMGSLKWVNAWKDGLEARDFYLNVLLTNGFRFERHESGTKMEFSAPDALFGDSQVRAKELFGKWRVSRRAAVKIAREAVARLELDPSIYSPKKGAEIKKPFSVGKELIPRYLVAWRRERGGCRWKSTRRRGGWLGWVMG